MSVFFEGNAFIDGGQIQNATVGSSSITGSAIAMSTLDMNYANITSVKDPVLQSDAATKQYVDDLGIRIIDVDLTGTNFAVISSNQKGSFLITIQNKVSNGPTATFTVSKSEPERPAHIVRTSCAPGLYTGEVFRVRWNVNSGLELQKTGLNYNGTYRIKIM